MTPSPILSTALPFVFGAVLAVVVAVMVATGRAPALFGFPLRFDAGDRQARGLYWAVVLGVALAALLMMVAGFAGV